MTETMTHTDAKGYDSDGPIPRTYTYPTRTFHDQVWEFKRGLIRRTLEEHGGNRTHAAKALGLQRTYLLRLMRTLEVEVPAPITLRSTDGTGRRYW